MPQIYRHRTSQSTDTGLGLLEPLMLLLGGVATLICALPALVIGLAGERVLRDRAWSLALWLGLTVVSLGVITLFALHGLGQLVIGQLVELLWQARVHQANLLQWDGAQLWAKTWPVWLDTLVLAPVIAAVRVLASSLHSGGAASLRTQERLRQQAVARAQRRATRRLRHVDRLPDLVAGQMVMGVPIDDELNS